MGSIPAKGLRTSMKTGKLAVRPLMLRRLGERIELEVGE
jgi:hypothetical protein